MARSGTEAGGERDGAVSAVPIRALTLVAETRGDAEPGRTAAIRPRPPAGFVTQLILGADPALRPSRLTRTRDAAALYAKAARLLA